jgi:hypothetical protein
MRAMLSLSGAMRNWFVVSEMSWEVEVLVGVCEGVGGGGGGMHCYGVFVEEDHGGRSLCGCRCMRQLVD